VGSAGGDFSASWLTTKKQHRNNNQLLNKSIINADHNGAVFMDD